MAKNLGFKIVYATDEPLFNRNKILKMSFSKKYPGTGWLPLFAQGLRKDNIKIVTADIAYSLVLQKKWQPQQLIVIQDMDAKDGQKLIKLGAFPCAVVSFESPLYAYTFHAKIKKNTSIFKNRILWKGLLKHVSTSTNNYVCPSASYFSNQIIRPKNWTDRKFLVLVAANKYFKKNFPYKPKYLTEHIDWFRDQIWIASSPIRKEAIKNELITKKLEIIEYFGKKKLLNLFGHDWDNLENLPRSWRNRLNQVIPALKPKPIKDKLKTIANYKFSIAYENTSYSGFVAEKITDCFVAGTIPIYLGAPDVTKFVPKNTFIDMRDFNSFEKLHQFLTKLKTAEAMRMISNGRKFLESPEGKKHDYYEVSNFFLKIVDEYQISISRMN